LKLTISEIKWRIRAIDKRLSRDREFQMDIHGIEYKKGVDTKDQVITEDQKKALDVAFEQAKKRKRKESNGRKINDSN
jgi:hypothetical protein